VGYHKSIYTFNLKNTMTQLSEKRKALRGRIYPEQTIPPEELARREAERTELRLRGQKIFERIRPELIGEYYNWFIAIDPDSEEYLIDPKLLGIVKKIKEQYGDKSVMLTTFRLNETGTCGRI
jgi:hypothetical protein